MNPKSQKQLVEFLKTVEEGISKKEFLTAFTMLKNYVEDTKVDVNNKLATTLKELSDEMSEEHEEMEGEMETMYTEMDVKHKEHTKEVTNLIDDKVKVLESKIPDEFDSSKLEQKIDDSINQLRSEIPTIPEIPTLDTGEQIVDKINDLPIDDDSLKIGIEHIKGLLQELKELREMNSSRSRVISSPRRYMVSKYSLTSQCNGVTKAFTLPTDTMEVLGVFGSQFPVQYDPSGDWTFSGRTLTLGSSVGAPETGQTLWALIQTLN